MKPIKHIFFLLILALGVSSCNDDGYSLDKFIVDIVTVNDEESGLPDFTLDNGSGLSVAATSTNYKAKYKRAIINYTPLGEIDSNKDTLDYYIKLNRVYDVLTKDPIYINPEDEQKQDSIGHDPVKIHSIWIGGGYMNMYYGVNVGGVATHYINLVSAEPIDPNNLPDVVKLEFRHNKNDDPENYGAKNYVSFDLAPYRKSAGGTIKFEISVKEFGSETPKTYNLEYEYSGNGSRGNGQSPAIDTPEDNISE